MSKVHISDDGSVVKGDAAFVADCDRVDDPVAVLELFHTHREYVGTDPYYRDLNDAMWRALERVLSKQPRSAI